MGLIDTLRNAFTFSPARTNPLLSFQDWVNYFTFNGNAYATGLNQTLVGNREEIAAHFTGLVAGAYKNNGIVFACMVARHALFSEARFQFRQLRNGRPGDLFGNESLRILERPWRGASTSDLLIHAIQDQDLAGTAFIARRSSTRLARLRPDWVTMVIGSPYADADDSLSAYDVDAELLGAIYRPGGQGSGREPITILAKDLAVFKGLTPDPTGVMRGLSWLTALIPDIQADTSATAHKERFFVNGATVNLVVDTGVTDPTKFREWVKLFEEGHRGTDNAYKTLYLMQGADAKAIGANLQQSDFRAVQQLGETRIAAASGMHPVIVGLSEGLQGSSLNSGNFEAAARLTANKTLRPLWRNFARSLEEIVPAPPASELWYDDRDIPFLADDVEIAAKVQGEQAKTIQSLITAGYKPDSVIEAVTAGDYELLKGQHTGLYSVQLQPPQTVQSQIVVPANGKGSEEDANAVVSQEG